MAQTCEKARKHGVWRGLGAEQTGKLGKVGLRSKLVLPLILGLLVSAVGVAVFWYLRGRPKLW